MPLWCLQASFYPTSSFDLVHTSPDSLTKMPQKCGVKMIIPQLPVPNVNKIHHVMHRASAMVIIILYIKRIPTQICSSF